VVGEQVLGVTQTIFRPKISHTHKNIHFNCVVHKSNYVDLVACRKEMVGNPSYKGHNFRQVVAQIPMTCIGLLKMQSKSQ
jgi:hypothetical protein